MKHIQRYLIEKGTKLFRRSQNLEIGDEMFFGFCPYGTFSSFHSNVPIQVWITLSEIKGNLMLKDINNQYRLKSSIPNIYNSYDSSPDCDLMELKKFGSERNKLIEFFRKQEIKNWVSSVEDKYEMELFLFSNKEEISTLVKYSRQLDPKEDCDKMNSFDYAKLNR